VPGPPVGQQPSAEELAERDAALGEAVDRALAQQFRPELLNRIDEVIRFRPLRPEDLARIVRLQLAELAALLQEQQLVLQVDEAVRGPPGPPGLRARIRGPALRRLLRRSLENPLATELLEERYRGYWGVGVSEAPGDGRGQAPLLFTPLVAPPGQAPRPGTKGQAIGRRIGLTTGMRLGRRGA
jgi:ATP-dependent Clp protease ATP-binding subunit ClpA